MLYKYTCASFSSLRLALEGKRKGFKRQRAFRPKVSSGGWGEPAQQDFGVGILFSVEPCRGERGVPSLLARRMGRMVQQKHFHCGLCYFLFRTPGGPTLGLPGAPGLPPEGAAGHGRDVRKPGEGR